MLTYIVYKSTTYTVFLTYFLTVHVMQKAHVAHVLLVTDEFCCTTEYTTRRITVIITYLLT